MGNRHIPSYADTVITSSSLTLSRSSFLFLRETGAATSVAEGMRFAPKEKTGREPLEGWNKGERGGKHTPQHSLRITTVPLGAVDGSFHSSPFALRETGRGLYQLSYLLRARPRMFHRYCFPVLPMGYWRGDLGRRGEQISPKKKKRTGAVCGGQEGRGDIIQPLVASRRPHSFQYKPFALRARQ